MNAYATLLLACDLVVKSSALLLATRLSLSAWRTASANQRYTAWLITFATLLLLPVSLLFQPRWQFYHGGNAAALEPAFQPARLVQEAPVLETDHGMGSLAEPKMPAWDKLLKIIWLGGFAGILGYRFLGSFRLFALRRHSPILREDLRVSRLCEQMKTALEIKRRIDVRITSACKIPMTWGTLSPILHLPPEALEWSDGVLFAALCHEGAHIVRKDHFSRWLTQIACAIYWPNPLVWSANRSLRLAQEQSADDYVLRAGTPAEDYANQLLQTASNMKKTPSSVCNALGMATSSTLERRLLAILDSSQSRVSSGWVTKLTALGLAAIALCGSASAQLKEGSKQQMSESAGKSQAASAAAAKARKIIIPQMHFSKATLQEGLDYLRMKSRDLDPEKTGVNLVLCTTPSTEKPKPLSFLLTNISLYDAFNAISKVEGYNLIESQDALILASPDWKPSPAEVSGENNPIYLKAQKIILPRVEFKAATALEAVSYLTLVSKSLDPDQKGINIVLQPSNSTPPPIYLSLRNVPVTSVLSYAAQCIGYGLKFEDGVFYLEPSK